MVPWNPARTKIKLSIQRLRTLQEKKLALAKISRREIADLLLKGRVETARLRVEGLIQDDIYVELLELLELYSEALQARFNLLDASSGTEPEASISDAVCAIVYAAPRTELKELQVLREMLMHKYGRAFSLALQPTDPAPSSVPERIRSKLALFVPARGLVDAYLYEIARGYHVDWEPTPPGDGGDGEGGGKEIVGDADGEGAGKSNGANQENQKEAVGVLAEDASDIQGEEGSRNDAAAPGVPAATASAAPAAPKPTEAKKKLTEEEELAQRFERLKNLR